MMVDGSHSVIVLSAHGGLDSGVSSVPSSGKIIFALPVRFWV